jgi:cyclase
VSPAVALPDKPSLIPLAPGVWFFFNANGMSNAGVIEEDDGLTVIDTLLTPAMALDFLRMVREVNPKPVRQVILTHFHGDHILGAEAFTGARLIAHENTRRYLKESGDYELRRFAGRPDSAAALANARVRLPELTFSSRLTLHSGERAVELSWPGPAHTSGDTIISVPKAVVSLPKDGIVFVGDLLFNGVMPVLRSASPSGWIETLKGLEANPDAVVIPGHGPVAGVSELTVMRRFLEDCLGLVRSAVARGATEQEILAIEVPRSAREWPGQERWQGALQRAWEEVRGLPLAPPAS